MAMKAERMVQHLADAVRKLGYKVRTEEGNFQDGSCVFAEDKIVFLNRRTTHEERAELLARTLVDENLDSLYLLPEVRAFIERHLPKEMAKPAAEPPASQTGDSSS